jgi:hypothetical protein
VVGVVHPAARIGVHQPVTHVGVLLDDLEPTPVREPDAGQDSDIRLPTSTFSLRAASSPGLLELWPLLDRKAPAVQQEGA